MSGRIAFRNVTIAQHTKLVRQPMLWIELAVLAALVLLVTTLPHVLPSPVAATLPPVPTELGVELRNAARAAANPSLGGLLLIILAGAAVAREYEWRSLHLWLGSGVSRRTFLTSKVVALLGPTLLMPLTAVVVAAPVAAFFIHREHGAVALAAGPLLDALAAIPVAAFALLPYVALAVFLAVWGRSLVAAIGVGLAYALVGEGVLIQLLVMAGGWAATVAGYFPASLGRAVLGADGGPIPVLAPGAAASLIAVYVAVMLGGAILLFERQDLGE